jgi:hypothetical protein
MVGLTMKVSAIFLEFAALGAKQSQDGDDFG